MYNVRKSLPVNIVLVFFFNNGQLICVPKSDKISQLTDKNGKSTICLRNQSKCVTRSGQKLDMQYLALDGVCRLYFGHSWNVEQYPNKLALCLTHNIIPARIRQAQVTR